MTNRSVTDTTGRTWMCTAANGGAAAPEQMGRDVSVSCTTATVPEGVELTVGWQWETMSDNGLARLITTKSPAPRKLGLV